MILIDVNRKNEGKNKCWLVYSTSFMRWIRLLRQQGKWREEKNIRNLVIKVSRIYSVPSHSLHVRMSSRVICSALYLTEKKSFIIGSDFGMIYSWQRHLSSNNKKIIWEFLKQLRTTVGDNFLKRVIRHADLSLSMSDLILASERNGYHSLRAQMPPG